MQDSDVEHVVITERPNGWWVTVERPGGSKEHHGPYVDEDLARIEARSFSDDFDVQAIDPPAGEHTGELGW